MCIFWTKTLCQSSENIMVQVKMCTHDIFFCRFGVITETRSGCWLSDGCRVYCGRKSDKRGNLHETSERRNDSYQLVEILWSRLFINYSVTVPTDSPVPLVKAFLRNPTPTVTTAFIVLLNHQCAGGAARCLDTQ